MKILLVEDDQSIAAMLCVTLTAHRYAVDLASDGQLALELLMQWDYDLILLDVLIPELDGISLCRQLRSLGNQTPILMLTAQNSPENVITGLDAGADDYVIKPFNSHQLLARIRALLRRGDNATATVLNWGYLCLDPTLMKVTYKQQEITFRPKEYTLLELFLRHQERIFSRNAIIDRLWSSDQLPSEAAVTTLIKDLRSRLKAAGINQTVIETVHGLGYRLKAAPTVENSIEVQDSNGENDTQTHERVFVSEDAVEERFRLSLEQRIRVLEDIEVAHKTHQLSPEQQSQGREEAHKLVGGLGIFGYGKGSEIARLIEHLLKNNSLLEEHQGTRFSELLAELKALIALPPTLLTEEFSSNSLVLAVGRDAAFTKDFTTEAPRWGLRMEVVSDHSTVLHRLTQTTPAVILLALEPDGVDNYTLLQTLKVDYPAIPIVILSGQDSLDERVAAARLGVEQYLSQPRTSNQVFEALIQVLPSLPTIERLETKVMIVDDDPVMLDTLARMLRTQGLEVICLAQPDQFWALLTTTDPAALLLDLEMPTYNGLELCRVVRQDPRYSQLPILVVTAHTDPESMRRAFAVGANDVLEKPVVEAELVTRIISRIKPLCPAAELNLNYMTQQ
ncbi:Protein RcaC (plasmid) [Planktothrix tepida]|uniref:Multi-component transcriptional regulator, winged helix family n=1 Tax=Planktothrix tepida PCC 9214 TaxID=671072 RepID=A0A1J1LSV8_9CYAN|nr:response regulator [Planktothrix tepida]CAD5988938.1 Protein RcaC [Planktothrix tepida]CUR35688.1 Multi-component transcriptional regulator, winged helix family [Planktothrix tepida PCC 9214]